MKATTGILVFSFFIFLFTLTPKEAEADGYRALQNTEIAWTISAMAFFYPALYFTGRSKNPEATYQCPQWFLLAYCDTNLNYCTAKPENGKAAVCIDPSASKQDAQFPSYTQATDANIVITSIIDGETALNNFTQSYLMNLYFQEI